MNRRSLPPNYLELLNKFVKVALEIINKNWCGRKGEKSPSWKGWITPLHNQIRGCARYRDWVYAVFARDNFTCQETGIKGGELCAHHVHNFANYPELRFAIDNGITLSKKAHKEFHRIYGNKNTTKEQLEEFLKNDNEKI